jgi:hypothetical protein
MKRALADAPEDLDRALEWQRAQAWATWERIKAGESSDVGFETVEAEFDKALAPKRRHR